ncbi:hypothetical protein RFI_11895 [Reticulomyxa filosa]|uniref:SH3 domain-containing protein n=1 Tax=Reticulomyxa filosa TaxID=46433 RepID=X6NH70_RETFI|nr:hypothetical protein RFI_11895 [Reticulomyxa filosa]|eukprot:ETO25243.1 hypothetical protein RFI_11895 [Reticulomyxa filosa]
MKLKYIQIVILMPLLLDLRNLIASVLKTNITILQKNWTSKTVFYENSCILYEDNIILFEILQLLQWIKITFFLQLQTLLFIRAFFGIKTVINNFKQKKGPTQIAVPVMERSKNESEGVWMTVIYDFAGEPSSSELSVKREEKVLVKDLDPDLNGWAYVEVGNNRKGYIPASYLGLEDQKSKKHTAFDNTIICSFHREFVPEIQDLTNYFSRFGKIVNKVQIIVDQQKQIPISAITFEDSASCDGVIEQGTQHRIPTQTDESTPPIIRRLKTFSICDKEIVAFFFFADPLKQHLSMIILPFYQYFFSIIEKKLLENITRIERRNKKRKLNRSDKIKLLSRVNQGKWLHSKAKKFLESDKKQ